MSWHSGEGSAGEAAPGAPSAESWSAEQEHSTCDVGEIEEGDSFQEAISVSRILSCREAAKGQFLGVGDRAI